jgi:Pyridoxamine 5'-phosphate oxidase
MDWSELERHQPGLAGLGRRRLLEPGVVLVATIRGDGTPRVSPVEPFVLDGVLWLSMLWGSRKAADLLRDPRVLVHSVITSRDGGEGEFKIRGTVRAEDDPDVQARYAAAVGASLGWTPEPGRDILVAGPGRLSAVAGPVAQLEGHHGRGSPGEQGHGVGHDQGQVACGDAVAEPQREPDQQDREVPEGHIARGPLPQHPAHLQKW